MNKLEVNKIYTLKVLEVAENAEQFPGTKTGAGLVHCHHLKLSDKDGLEYFGQLCNSYTFYRDCSPGDMIDVTIKSESRGKHTFTSLVNKSIMAKVKDEVGEVSDHRENLREVKNIPMAGTAAALALNAAVQTACHSDRAPGEAISPTVVIDHAGIYLEWLLMQS